ncbi:ATP-dependent Clp protease proteolytic subunit [Paraburkholderia sp. EG287A]|uniref:ATP-dependent Clp protease proteolytic subunit n=1 Tax=Paraburkholderia sp. EG287A TaxID=3237012 RepID=UPI0034D1F1A9
MRNRYSRVTRMSARHTREPAFDRDEDDDLASIPPYQVFATPGHLDVYLSSEIVLPVAYDELCHELRQMGEEDSVTMYINSPGGNLMGGLAIIQAMQDCPATIRTVLHPVALSVSALIFLSGDEYEVPSFGQLMLHHYADRIEGKGHELRAEVDATEKWFESFSRDICRGFVTDAEMADLLAGRDVWLLGEDIDIRILRMEMVQAGLEPND